MDAAEIPQNNSQAELVNNIDDGILEGSGESSQTNQQQTLRNVKLYEWIVVLILCYVNLINYMDRFTLAGKFHKYLNNFQNFFVIYVPKKNYSKVFP